MSATEKYAAALDELDANAERIARKAAEVYDAAVEEAAEELVTALAVHDAKVSAAEGKRAGDAKTEQGRTNALRARAEQEFDTAMREQYGARDVQVVVTDSGVLELRSGRQRLASCFDQGNVWRVDTPAGAQFVPSAPAARHTLWAVLDPELAVA